MAKKSSPREGSVPPPKCKAILLCERLIIEAETHQVSLIGLFDAMEVLAVPGTMRAFTVYLLLSDGIVGHEYNTSMEIQDLRADNVLVRAPGRRLQWQDRLAKRDLFFTVPPQPIQHAGSYEVVVFADGQEIDRQRFSVIVPEALDGEEEQDRG